MAIYELRFCCIAFQLRDKIVPMIKDTRPALEQVKSGFKIAGILVVVCASLLVLLSLLPIHRIGAWWWHWKHGNSIEVGEFRVPVPNEWSVWSFDTGMTHEVELQNTKGGKHFWATITITQETRPPNASVTDLVALRRHSMENLGIHVTETRQLTIGGTPGFCIDGETAMAGLPVRNISCRVGAAFALEYIGSSLKAPSFYVILEGISKPSNG